MTDKPGPWDLPDAPPSPPAATPAAPRDRLWLWLGALAAVGVLIAALAHAYPEALRSGDDKVELVYRLMLVLLVSGGLLRAARRPLTRHLKHAVIWMAAFAVLAFGYAYRTELADAPRRLRMAFNIGAPIQVDERTLVVPQSDDGAYVVDGLVNGQRVRFTVDTGSTAGWAWRSTSWTTPTRPRPPTGRAMARSSRPRAWRSGRSGCGTCL
jgi:aspartyl protease family protein